MKKQKLTMLTTAAMATATAMAGVAKLSSNSFPGVELFQTGSSSSSLAVQNHGWSGAIDGNGLLYLAGNSIQPKASYPETTVMRLLSSGSVDNAWASGGAALTNVSSGAGDQARACMPVAGGALVAAGDAKVKVGKSTVDEFELIRYSSSGSLDGTFGSSGIVTAAPNSNGSGAYAVAQLSDGSLIAAGYNSASWAIGKFSANGALNTSFGHSGWVIQSFPQNSIAFALAVDASDNILVTGQAGAGSNQDITVARYTKDGVLDASFGGTGIVYLDFGANETSNAIALQGDGKILVGGGDETSGHIAFNVARFNPDGSLDTTFNGTGYVTFPETTGQVRGLAVQSNGQIIVAGDDVGTIGIAALNPDGSRDVTYNGGAVNSVAAMSDAEPKGVYLQSDGKAVVTGYASGSGYSYFMFARFNIDGSLDTSF